jgi:hypothetical protein
MNSGRNYIDISIEYNSLFRLFSETSNRKNISHDSPKTPIKVRRDEKHLCPYW